MTAVRKAFLLSTFDSYLGVALQLAGTMIVSRLLTPTEVGVFAIAAVFAALASTFRDFGVAEYLIQERELTTDKIRAAFALNIIVSWSMALALALGAPLVASFYGEPVVQSVIWVMALNFVLVPFGAVVQAWFRRNLNYTPIVVCNLLSSLAIFVTSVGLAWLGFGSLALAWSTFSGIVVTVLAVAWFRPREFPLLPSLRGIGQVFHFGKFASAIYVVSQVGKGAPELIIGRASGPADVGIFSRANGLVEMFNRLVMKPVLQVCLPYFSQSHRESGSMLTAYYRSVGLLTAAGWPLLGLLAVLAYPAVRIVYGPQWLEAVPLARILCAAAMLELLFTLSREGLLSCGQARRANTLQLQLTGLQVAGLLAAIPFGLPGACWGLLAAAILSFGVSQWHLKRGLGLELRALLVACRPSAVLATAVVAPLAVATWSDPPTAENFGIWAVAAGAYAAVAWLASLRLLGHPLWDEVVAIAVRVRSRRASS